MIKNGIRIGKAGEKVLFPELSYHLMGIAFEIHNTLGPGFTEDLYEAAFVQELKYHGTVFEQQKPIQVRYKGQVIGIYRLDLLVDNKIVVELKAVSALNDFFKQQVLSYLKAGDFHLGLLLNFGSKRLEYDRVVH